MTWIDVVLIMAASGLAAFLLALGIVRVWRALGGGSASTRVRLPPPRKKVR